MPNPIAIKEVISSIIGGLGVEEKSEKDEITRALSSALGEKTARHIKPQHYQGQKLIVNVDSSAWLYKLKLEENLILKKLNSSLPNINIKELSFRLGAI